MSRLEACDQIDGVNAKRNAARSGKPTSKAKRRVAPEPARQLDGSQPRYLQVARELKRSIANGAYPVGARPSACCHPQAWWSAGNASEPLSSPLLTTLDSVMTRRHYET